MNLGLISGQYSIKPLLHPIIQITLNLAFLCINEALYDAPMLDRLITGNLYQRIVWRMEKAKLFDDVSSIDEKKSDLLKLISAYNQT